MSEGSAEHVREIKEKTVRGASVMLIRQIVLMGVNLASNILLARLLVPADFGFFVVAQFFMTASVSVTELGFGAALIQREHDPDLRECRTIFTMQFVLTLLLVVCFAAVSGGIVVWRPDLRGLLTFLGLMTLTLLPASVGSISAVKLERRLAYNILARIDVAATTVDKCVAIGCAYAGFGYWSFLLGVASAGIVRALFLVRNAPWQIGFSFDRETIRKMVGFGGMFQLAGMTALVRDNVNAILIGSLFGAREVGLLNWAHNTTLYVSQIFTQIVNRITFPSLSRLQDNREAVGSMVNTALKLLNAITIPALLVLCLFIDEVVTLVYTDKWTAAIPAVYWYAALMTGGNFTTTLSGMLLATGAARENFIIMAGWTVVVWIAACAAVFTIGYTGAAAGAVIAVALVTAVLVHQVRKRIPVPLSGTFFKPLFCAVVAVGLFYPLKQYIHTIPVLLLCMASAWSTGFFFNLLADSRLRQDLRYIARSSRLFSVRT